MIDQEMWQVEYEPTTLDSGGDLLQVTRNRLHNRVRSDDYYEIGATKGAIEALIGERELLEKIST